MDESSGSSGSSSGPATDRNDDPVKDPTPNVKDLNEAANRRQDDLREIETAHVREILDLRSKHASSVDKLNSKLIKVKFSSVKREQKMTNEHRLELKGDGEKALSAALSAADKAVEKAVTGMEKLIVNNYQISKAATDALGDKVEGLKESVALLVNQRIGANDQRQEQRSISGGMVALVGLGVTILFSVITVMITLFLRS